MKKLLSIILSILMLFSVMPLSGITALATSKTRSEAVSWANSKVGQSIDWDGCYGAQCVDLIAAYYNYLGASTPGGNACAYAYNALPSGWKRVQNASGVVPEPGDIAVYDVGWKGGKYGHVAIVINADLYNMTTVEQYGSTDHKTHKVTYPYNRGNGYHLWGFIKPNFPGSSSSNGNMTTPTITLNKTNFNYGDTVNISWAKTASGTDFYQYWIVIKNTTTGKQIYAGATGSNGDVNANSYSFKINSYGAYSVTVYAVPYNDKNNRQKSASKTFTTGGYTVSFNANGGSGAPSAINTNVNGITAMPSTKPTYNDKHTVTFDANGGTLTSGSKTEYNKVFDYWYDYSGKKYYANGSTYSFKANTTLYAHYSYEKLSAKDPTMNNAYFIGWYDSSERDQCLGPTGNLYKNNNTTIAKDVTLYAMWSDSRTRLFGDIDNDGGTDTNDASVMLRYLSSAFSLSTSQIFIADLNCDGIINNPIYKEGSNNSCITNTTGNPNIYDSDLNLLLSSRVDIITYNDFPAVKYCTGFTIKTYPQTTYDYGEEFDYDGIVLQSNYSNNANVHHYVSDDIVISGYDPYKIGKQTITAHFYQWSVTFEITVNAPDYILTYDANGGYVYEENKVIHLNQAYGTLATPEREGYTFLGWFTSADGGTQITASTTATNQNDITVYAHWSLNTYSLSFNANGGTGAPAGINNINYGTSVQIPANQLTNGDYLFLGWSEEQGSSFADYEAGDSIYIDENTTLYAVWGTTEQTEPEPSVHVHTYISKVIAPTCTENGYTLKMCSACGETDKTDFTFATGHTEEADAAVPATYTSEGKTAGKHCSVCGAVLVAQKPIAKLAKKANTLSANGKTVKAKKNKKTVIKTAKAFTIKNAIGAVTYKKASGNKKITVAKNGKITVKKGLKKGNYKVKIQVTAAGNAEYNAAVKTVTVTIKVK